MNQRPLVVNIKLLSH